MPRLIPRRRDRQRVEIIALISHDQLQRAADLAHEHLAEFPDDGSVRTAIVEALNRNGQHTLRRRVDEFAGPMNRTWQPSRQGSESGERERRASPTDPSGAAESRRTAMKIAVVYRPPAVS